MTTKPLRHAWYGVLAGCVLTSASVVIAPPVAHAAPDPCSASAMVAAAAAVSNSISAYLDQHPDVNQALTDITRQPPLDARTSFRNYFLEHPDVANDLRNLRGPLNDLDTCGQIAPQQLTAALETP